MIDGEVDVMIHYSHTLFQLRWVLARILMWLGGSHEPELRRVTSSLSHL